MAGAVTARPKEATMTSDGQTTVDAVVIGAGPAGEAAAGRLGDGGLAVTIVERELVGGECSYWGCIPSKVLIRPGAVLAAARSVPGAAEAITGPLDVAAALAKRDEATSSWHDDGQLPWLEQHHVRLVRGVGRLTGERSVQVVAGDGAVTRLEARQAVVLATGTRAAMPPIPGLAEASPWDNRDVTAMKEVPRRLLCLGGGTVGLEMAQAVKRLGADEVTVLEGLDHLLGREEPFAGQEVRAGLEADGIEIVTSANVVAVARPARDGPVTVTVEDGREFVGDELLVAVGRRPATTELGLDSIGLTPGRPVEVDDRLRAAGVDGDWLYAVGDVNGQALLTHMGKYQARVAAEVILGKDVRDEASRSVIPRVTFTDPQVAAVGLTEAKAREAGITVRTARYGTSDVPGAYVAGLNGGTSLLVVDADRQVLVGATFTGPEVQELVHAATVAIIGQVKLERLWHAVPSFPTVSEVWLHLLEDYGL
jgi:pyruvate/2-oxoglutarate dehydrogenase complex dihydrolipoamide dehydrogenase (E3) component